MNAPTSEQFLLIADDSAEKREYLEFLVRRASLTTMLDVFSCETAQGALTFIQRNAHCIAAALFDNHFEGERMTGVQLIRALREANATALIAQIPRGCSPEKEKAGLEAGANAVIDCNAGEKVRALLAQWKETILQKKE